MSVISKKNRARRRAELRASGELKRNFAAEIVIAQQLGAAAYRQAEALREEWAAA